MWNRMFGKSNERENNAPSQSNGRKGDDRSSTRHRTESRTESISSSKPAPKSSRGDDRDRGLDPTTSSYSSTTRKPFPSTASASIGSSYATAFGNQIDDPYTAPELIRNQSMADQVPKTNSGRDERDRNGRRTRKSERKERSPSRNKKKNGQERSRSRDRGDKESDKRIKGSRKGVDVAEDLEMSKAESYGVGDARAPAHFSGNFNEQVQSSGFMQFPGQYDGPTLGFVGGPPVTPARMSDHVQDQFPGQFPTQSTAPYRPPLAVSEGGPGLAADYYNDGGQSVAGQPGVRIHSPSLIVGAEPHLQAASSNAAPPLEPSASGAVGAAASFFNGGFDAKTESHANYTHNSDGKNNASNYQPSSSKPLSTYEPALSRLDNNSYSSSAPVIPTLGAAAAGAAAGYMMSNQTSSNQHYHESSMAGGHQTGYTPTSDPRPPRISNTNSSTLPSLQASRPSKYSSQNSNVPSYAVSATGAAGLAAAASAYQHNHHSDHNNSHVQQHQASPMAQRHHHQGPLSKFVDFFKDPDGVAQFEAYSEYIGVCKYCFAPGSSPRDAPRKHHYRRRRSNERFGSSTRIDKDNRYWSSDGENRRQNRNSWLATGITGYGLAKLGESLFSQNNGVDDKYSAQTSRHSKSHESSHGRRNGYSPDRKSYNSHVVTRRSSDTRTRRENHSNDKTETGITSDGKIYKKDLYGGKFGDSSVVTYEPRQHARSRSRSKGRERHSNLAEAALGAAIGSSVVISSSRRQSRSPEKAFVRGKRRSRAESPGSSSILNLGIHSNAQNDNRLRQSPPSSRIDLPTSSYRSESGRRSKPHKKEKKKKGFFSFGNGSSSSSDSALAFGGKTNGRRNSQPSKTKERDHKKAEAAMLGLSAAAVALALNENREGNREKRKGEVRNTKESTGSHGLESHINTMNKNRPSALSPEDDSWVSASEDEYSSADSILAYGADIRKGRSQESLSSESSGMSKWGWRWGSKKQKGASKRDKLASDISVSGQPGANVTGLAGDTSYVAGNRQQPTGIGSPGGGSLQQVYPVATSDPSRFDVTMERPVTSSSQPSITTRPAPIPIQHPQPIAPVPATVYSTQAPYGHSYSDPKGKVVYQAISHPQPSIINRQPDEHFESHQNSIPGAFPRDGQLPGDTSFAPQDLRPRRRDTAPSGLSTNNGFGSKSGTFQTPAQEEYSGVRFDLTSQQSEKDRHESLQRKKEEDRREKRQQNREDEDQRERRRQERGDEDRRERRRQEREDQDRRDRRERRKADEQRESLKNRPVLQGKSSEVGDSELLRKESPPEHKPVITPRVVEIIPKEESSWTAPVAAGTIGVAVGAVMGLEKSISSEMRQDRRKPVGENQDVERTSEKHQAPFQEIPHPLEGVDTRGRPIEEKPDSVWQAVAKASRRSSSHEDYGTFFAPPELQSRSDSQRQVSDEDAPETPVIITVKPKGFDDSSHSPAYSFTLDADEVDVTPIDTPSWVPKIKLITPTPTPSRAGSINLMPSPEIQPHNEVEVNDTNSPTSKTDPKVTWGKPETIEYTVITPNYELDQYVASPPSLPSDDENPRSRLSNSGADEINRASPTKVKSSHHADPDYGDDLEFAATLAASLEDTGFDPSIVIDNPNFRRRNSPPGSEKGGFPGEHARQLDTSHEPGHIVGEVSSSPMPGTFDDEMPQIEIGQIEQIQKDLASKDQGSREMTEKPAERSTGEPIVDPASSRPASSEQDNYRQNVTDEMDGTEANEPKKPMKANTNPENSAYMPSGPTKTHEDEYFDAAGSLSKSSETNDRPLIDNDNGVNDPTTDRQSDNYDSDGPAGYVSLPRIYPEIKNSKGVESPTKNDLYESPSEDAPSAPATASIPKDIEESKRSRRKSKRKSSNLADEASVASSIVSANGGEVITKSKKEKKGGSIFSLFSRSTDDTPEPAQSKDLSKEASPGDFDELGIQNKKGKSRKSARQGEDAKSGVSDSAALLKRSEEDVDEHRSRKSRGGGDRRRSDGDSTTKDSGRITQDLPIQVLQPASVGYTLPDKMLTDPKDEESTRSNEALRINTGENSPLMTAKEQRTHDDKTDSFLGIRQEIPPLPDALGDAETPHLMEMQEKTKVVSDSIIPSYFPSINKNSDCGEKIDSPPALSSNPTSPLSKADTYEPRFSGMQKDDAQIQVQTPSPTAVPLNFRRPPSSPGVARSLSSAPMSPASSTTTIGPPRLKPRPRSTEFKSSTEFRPLWLPELHKPRQELPLEESYPSLPSSHTTSRSSSIHDPTELTRDQTNSQDAAGAVCESSSVEPQLTTGTTHDSFRSDLLDSQQPTPTASSFPLVLGDITLEKKENQRFAPGEAFKPLATLDHPSITLPPPAQTSEDLNRTTVNHLSTPLHDSTFESTEDLPPLPSSRASSPGWYGELHEQEATAIPESMAETDHEKLFNTDSLDETAQPNLDPEHFGLAERNDENHESKYNMQNAALNLPRNPLPEVDGLSRKLDIFDVSDTDISVKNDNESTGAAATIEPLIGPVANTSASKAVEPLNAIEQQQLQEKDAQDAVDSWFSPTPLKISKKDKKTKKRRGNKFAEPSNMSPQDNEPFFESLKNATLDNPTSDRIKGLEPIAGDISDGAVEKYSSSTSDVPNSDVLTRDMSRDQIIAVMSVAAQGSTIDEASATHNNPIPSQRQIESSSFSETVSDFSAKGSSGQELEDFDKSALPILPDVMLPSTKNSIDNSLSLNSPAHEDEVRKLATKNREKKDKGDKIESKIGISALAEPSNASSDQPPASVVSVEDERTPSILQDIDVSVPEHVDPPRIRNELSTSEGMGSQELGILTLENSKETADWESTSEEKGGGNQKTSETPSISTPVPDVETNLDEPATELRGEDFFSEPIAEGLAGQEMTGISKEYPINIEESEGFSTRDKTGRESKKGVVVGDGDSTFPSSLVDSMEDVPADDLSMSLQASPQGIDTILGKEPGVHGLIETPTLVENKAVDESRVESNKLVETDKSVPSQDSQKMSEPQENDEWPEFGTKKGKNGKKGKKTKKVKDLLDFNTVEDIKSTKPVNPTLSDNTQKVIGSSVTPLSEDLAHTHDSTLQDPIILPRPQKHEIEMNDEFKEHERLDDARPVISPEQELNPIIVTPADVLVPKDEKLVSSESKASNEYEPTLEKFQEEKKEEEEEDTFDLQDLRGALDKGVSIIQEEENPDFLPGKKPKKSKKSMTTSHPTIVEDPSNYSNPTSIPNNSSLTQDLDGNDLFAFPTAKKGKKGKKGKKVAEALTVTGETADKSVEDAVESTAAIESQIGEIDPAVRAPSDDFLSQEGPEGDLLAATNTKKNKKGKKRRQEINFMSVDNGADRNVDGFAESTPAIEAVQKPESPGLDTTSTIAISQEPLVEDDPLILNTAKNDEVGKEGKKGNESTPPINECGDIKDTVDEASLEPTAAGAISVPQDDSFVSASAKTNEKDNNVEEDIELPIREKVIGSNLESAAAPIPTLSDNSDATHTQPNEPKNVALPEEEDPLTLATIHRDIPAEDDLVPFATAKKNKKGKKGKRGADPPPTREVIPKAPDLIDVPLPAGNDKSDVVHSASGASKDVIMPEDDDVSTFSTIRKGKKGKKGKTAQIPVIWDDETAPPGTSDQQGMLADVPEQPASKPSTPGPEDALHPPLAEELKSLPENVGREPDTKIIDFQSSVISEEHPYDGSRANNQLEGSSNEAAKGLTELDSWQLPAADRVEISPETDPAPLIHTPIIATTPLEVTPDHEGTDNIEEKQSDSPQKAEVLGDMDIPASTVRSDPMPSVTWEQSRQLENQAQVQPSDFENGELLSIENITANGDSPKEPLLGNKELDESSKPGDGKFIKEVLDNDESRESREFEDQAQSHSSETIEINTPLIHGGIEGIHSSKELFLDDKKLHEPDNSSKGQQLDEALSTDKSEEIFNSEHQTPIRSPNAHGTEIPSIESIMEEARSPENQLLDDKELHEYQKLYEDQLIEEVLADDKLGDEMLSDKKLPHEEAMEMTFPDDKPQVGDDLELIEEQKIDERVFADENVLTDKNSFAEGTLPIEETLPAEETLPTEEILPAKENLSAEKKLLVQENLPIEENLHVEDKLPIEEIILTKEKPYFEEKLPTKEKLPVEENLPNEENLPMEEHLPVEEHLPIEEHLPVEEHLPAEENLHAVEDLPAEKNLSVEENLSTDEKPPIEGKLSATENLPAEQSLPVEKNLSEEEKLSTEKNLLTEEKSAVRGLPADETLLHDEKLLAKENSEENLLDDNQLQEYERLYDEKLANEILGDEQLASVLKDENLILDNDIRQPDQGESSVLPPTSDPPGLEAGRLATIEEIADDSATKEENGKFEGRELVAGFDPLLSNELPVAGASTLEVEPSTLLEDLPVEDLGFSLTKKGKKSKKPKQQGAVVTFDTPSLNEKQQSDELPVLEKLDAEAEREPAENFIDESSGFTSIKKGKKNKKSKQRDTVMDFDTTPSNEESNENQPSKEVPNVETVNLEADQALAKELVDEGVGPASKIGKKNKKFGQRDVIMAFDTLPSNDEPYEKQPSKEPPDMESLDLEKEQAPAEEFIGGDSSFASTKKGKKSKKSKQRDVDMNFDIQPSIEESNEKQLSKELSNVDALGLEAEQAPADELVDKDPSFAPITIGKKSKKSKRRDAVLNFDIPPSVEESNEEQHSKELSNVDAGLEAEQAPVEELIDEDPSFAPITLGKKNKKSKRRDAVLNFDIPPSVEESNEEQQLSDLPVPERLDVEAGQAPPKELADEHTGFASTKKGKKGKRSRQADITTALDTPESNEVVSEEQQPEELPVGTHDVAIEHPPLIEQPVDEIKPEGVNTTFDSSSSNDRSYRKEQSEQLPTANVLDIEAERTLPIQEPADEDFDFVPFKKGKKSKKTRQRDTNTTLNTLSPNDQPYEKKQPEQLPVIDILDKEAERVLPTEKPADEDPDFFLTKKSKKGKKSKRDKTFDFKDPPLNDRLDEEKQSEEFPLVGIPGMEAEQPPPIEALDEEDAGFVSTKKSKKGKKSKRDRYTDLDNTPSNDQLDENRQPEEPPVVGIPDVGAEQPPPTEKSVSEDAGFISTKKINEDKETKSKETLDLNKPTSSGQSDENQQIETLPVVGIQDKEAEQMSRIEELNDEDMKFIKMDNGPKQEKIVDVHSPSQGLEEVLALPIYQDTPHIGDDVVKEAVQPVPSEKLAGQDSDPDSTKKGKADKYEQQERTSDFKIPNLKREEILEKPTDSASFNEQTRQLPTGLATQTEPTLTHRSKSRSPSPQHLSESHEVDFSRKDADSLPIMKAKDTNEFEVAAAAAAGLGAGLLGIESLQTRKSKKDKKKAKKSVKGPNPTDLDDEENSGSITPNVQEENLVNSPLRILTPELKPSDNKIQQYQNIPPEIPKLSTVDHSQMDVSGNNRDSAIHVSDSPHVLAETPVHRMARDSGYQDTEASPLIGVPFESTDIIGEKPIKDSVDPFSMNIENLKEADAQTQQSFPHPETISEAPLNISVEADPNYDVTISKSNPKRGRSRTPSGHDQDHDHDGHRRSPSKGDNGLGSPDNIKTLDDPREPSPISSTTKDRSSILFQSSPSTREDYIDQPPKHESPLHQPVAIEEQGRPDSWTLPDWTQSVDVPKAENLGISDSHARIPEASGGELPINPEVRPSIFGGPINISDDLRASSRSPFSNSSPTRQRLNTISENSPEDSPAHKKSRSISDVGSPERGVKSLRRSTALPQKISRYRSRSPSAAEVGTQKPFTSDDLIDRLSWPPVDEDNHSVGLERSRSRNTDVYPAGRIPSVAQERETERRSVSGASAGSVDSINAIIRTPDQVRTASGLSQRSTGTPPLRRSDRSVSGDLRVANKKSEAKGLAKIAKTIDANSGAETDNPDNDNHVIPSSSTYDPIKDKGKGRLRDMADVFEGWGDVRGGSPLSPTRPPSMRRRQSLQVLDLETKVDQLVSENRLLQDAKLRAEKTLENAEQGRNQEHESFTEAIKTRDLFLSQKNSELNELRHILERLQGQVSQLTEANEELAQNSRGEEHEQRYKQLEAEHANTHQLWQKSTRELEELRHQHSHLSGGMEEIVSREVNAALEEKNVELRRVHDELEASKEEVRRLQRQILASKNSNDLIVNRDEDYFDEKCQELCGHVQQWVLRFSKFSDGRVCYHASEVMDEKIVERFENAMLDGSDVGTYLKDRVKRRDVFMSVVMTMVWEYIFTRYLFGMDRENRQKLKALEKTLSEVGPMTAVRKWRATTLIMLSKRESFAAQRAQDTEAIVQEIYQTLATFLPPPSHLIDQIQASLRKVMGTAVDLSIEMRTQRAEYVMLPSLQPEYDTNGDLVHKVHFNASLMNERSGTTSSNDALESQQAVVRMVLFPLVLKKGDDSGAGDEEMVVCPAQVLTAPSGKEKRVRVVSAQGVRSAVSLGGVSDAGMGNMI